MTRDEVYVEYFQRCRDAEVIAFLSSSRGFVRWLARDELLARGYHFGPVQS